MQNDDSLKEVFDGLARDTKIKRSRVGGSSSSLQRGWYSPDKGGPDIPPVPVIKHPLIAFSLAIPRRSSGKEQFAINNGNLSANVCRGEYFGGKREKSISPNLPCCKQSRAFCILLLNELSKFRFKNKLPTSPASSLFCEEIFFKLGTNYTVMAEELGLSRSGKKDKDEFADHILRVSCCTYKNYSFGEMDEVDGCHHFSFGEAINCDIVNVHGYLDRELFNKYISLLNADNITELGTTYALDLYLAVVDRLSFNLKQENDLLTWNELFSLNGGSLKRSERYVEEMRAVFNRVKQFFPEIKLTSKGIRFFPD